MSWFNNLSLNLKLVFALLVSSLVIIIVSILLVGSSFDQIALATGQQDLGAEIDFLEARVDELADNLLFAANQLSNDDDLVEAMLTNNQRQIETFIVTTIGLTNATEIDIVNAEGESLLGEEDDEGVSEGENELISLGLLGSEFVRVAYEDEEAEESPLRLTAVVPVRTDNAELIGVILLGQEMDDDFLELTNFGRQSDHLLLSHDGEMIAFTNPENEEYDITTIAGLLNPAEVEQAQQGVAFIDDQITVTSNGYPQVFAHMPINVGGRINGIMTIVVDMQELFSLRNTIVQALTTSLIALVVVMTLFLLFIFRQSVIAPLGNIQAGVQDIMNGNYSQKIAGLSQDEIGQLGMAFNLMGEAVQSRETELSELNQSLERRVAERTADLKKARDEAVIAQRIANENSRLKSEFLSMMSHELRTPMNAIEGFTSIMLNHMAGTEYNDKTERYLGKIQSNSKRLLGLINDFLDLSRIESGRLELAYLPMSPTNMAQNWRDNLSSLAEKKGLELEVSVDPNLPQTMYGDEESLSKIAINLMGNAIKFTEEGRVSLTLEKRDDKMVMEVQDTGMGIPPHAREYIFDEFRQVDMSSKRQHGGTGLGLSIVQKLATAMGGTVGLQSEIGVGSTFTVTLPIQTEAVPV